MSHSDASPLADGFGRREGGFSGWIFSSDFTNEMDGKIYLENPAALPPTSVAAKPPLRFQSLPNLSSFSNLISIPYIDETVRFC